MTRAQITKLDTLLRNKLRVITKGRCEICHTHCTGRDSQVSHAFSRTIQRLRWDRLNVSHLDARCHFLWTKTPPLAVQTLRTLIGEAGLTELIRRYHATEEADNCGISFDGVERAIDNLKPGQYPEVSRMPLWMSIGWRAKL